MNSQTLQNRLIDFSVSIVELQKNITKTLPGQYLANQVVRSGISPSLNYAEAQSAESLKDFIHKMKISAKELRETAVSLSIIKRSKLVSNELLLNNCIKENNELISIFISSIKTCQKKLNN